MTYISRRKWLDMITCYTSVNRVFEVTYLKTVNRAKNGFFVQFKLAGSQETHEWTYREFVFFLYWIKTNIQNRPMSKTFNDLWALRPYSEEL